VSRMTASRVMCLPDRWVLSGRDHSQALCVVCLPVAVDVLLSLAVWCSRVAHSPMRTHTMPSSAAALAMGSNASSYPVTNTTHRGDSCILRAASRSMSRPSSCHERRSVVGYTTTSSTTTKESKHRRTVPMSHENTLFEGSMPIPMPSIRALYGEATSPTQPTRRPHLVRAAHADWAPALADSVSTSAATAASISASAASASASTGAPTASARSASK